MLVAYPVTQNTVSMLLPELACQRKGPTSTRGTLAEAAPWVALTSDSWQIPRALLQLCASSGCQARCQHVLPSAHPPVFNCVMQGGCSSSGTNGGDLVSDTRELLSAHSHGPVAAGPRQPALHGCPGLVKPAVPVAAAEQLSVLLLLLALQLLSARRRTTAPTATPAPPWLAGTLSRIT